MADDSPCSAYKVDTDIYIARRKRLHTVYDPAGELVFTGPHILDVLAWLADNDVRSAIFQDADDCFVVRFTRAPPTQPKNERP